MSHRLPSHGSGSTTDSGRRESSSSRLTETREGRVNRLSDEELENCNEIFEEKKSDKALVVQKINTVRFVNERSHHTDQFERDDVTIVRRGQRFYLFITFDRVIDVDNDMLRLQLTYGKQPRESKGTLVRIPLNLNSPDKTTDIERSWSVEQTISVRDGKALILFVASPPDAFIGYYNIYIETKQKGDEDSSRTKYNKRIVMLFNPWCKDDSVYMENDAERYEYVMNENGRIWKGCKYDNGSDPWNFGQFQSPVMSAALQLLERAELTDEARNNPVVISRKISALVNANDDEGILLGRWSKPYHEGTPPMDWIGSVAIIKKIIETGKPVKFGQCWVTTTLLRALGIPTRTVTNFESAHDHDVSMTIDKYMEEDGAMIQNKGDSIWNFHVWNESWFKRFDLPTGYDGWQVVDATPQESSGGVMQCGPAPVRAVKEGHVYLNYDIGFVYAEVNGDVMYWKKCKDGHFEFESVDHETVGWQMSTKAVGSNERNDISDNYRYPTGSAEETKVREFIRRSSTSRVRNIYKDEVQEKEIKVEIQRPYKLFGKDFSVHARIENTANEERQVSVMVTILHCYYTGVAGERVKVEQFNVTVGAKQEMYRTITVPFKEYKSVPNPECRFQLYLTAKNESTKRTNIKEETFVLWKPVFKFQVPKNVEFNTETKAVVKFTNTTSIALTKCKLRIESLGALDEVIIPRLKPLLVDEEWSETVLLKPFKETKENSILVAGFDSEELVGIMGSSDDFTVVNRPPPPSVDEDFPKPIDIIGIL